MTQQTINVGTVPNDGTGDPLRTAYQKTNANFTELYALTPPALVAGGVVFGGPSGAPTQDTANLFWNDTTDALGIGTAGSPTVSGLFVSKGITGGAGATLIAGSGVVQSDVTSAATGFQSFLGTQGAAFTLGSLYHFRALQGTFGLGSLVSQQVGFHAAATLAGAAQNIGFVSEVPAGASNFNFYANSLAPNYMAGSLGIGTAVLTGYKLRVGGTISGAPLAYGLAFNGVFQSDVTTAGLSFYSGPSTQAAAFVTAQYTHYQADGITLGAGSSVTEQKGFSAGANMTGATTNFGFFSNIPAGTGRWNFYALGTADNFMAGKLGVGAATSANVSGMLIQKTLTGSTANVLVAATATIGSDVTSDASIFQTFAVTSSAAFTTTNLYHYRANSGALNTGGSAVTSQFGFLAESTLTGAANNYGFMSFINAGAGNNWGFYANGTAPNHMAGKLGVGLLPNSGVLLTVGGAHGNAFASGIMSAPTWQSTTAGTDVSGFLSYPSTQAAAFTIGTLVHFQASQNVIGAGSAISNQYGFWARSTLTAGAVNIGFYTDIAAGANRWGFYAGGTVNNLFAGNTRIGSNAVPTVALDVVGAIAATTTIKTGVYTVATLPSASAAGFGARALVADATVATFATAVVGGGSASVPVYSNSSAWIIG